MSHESTSHDTRSHICWDFFNYPAAQRFVQNVKKHVLGRVLSQLHEKAESKLPADHGRGGKDFVTAL